MGTVLVGDDKNLIDKAKDALGMGDDDEHRDDRRTGVDRTDNDPSRGRNEGWGEDTGGATGTGGRTAGTGGTGYDTGRGPVDDDTTDTGRRETGM